MGRILWRLSGFVELLRPHNLVISAIATLLGFTTVSVVPDSKLDVHASIPSIATVILIAGGGYVINDFFDVDIDAVNKPTRPIPSGRVLRSEALALSIVLMASGIIIALLATGTLSFIYALLNAVLLVLYSKYVKRMGLLGNVIVGVASANSIVYGGLAASEATRRLDLVANTLSPALYAFIFTVMREFVKGIEDYVGDSRGGIKTLAVVKGVGYTARISAFLAVVIVAMSPLPYALGMYGLIYMMLTAVADIILLKSLVTLLKSKDDLEIIRRAALVKSYTKMAMPIGIAAFLLDLIIPLSFGQRYLVPSFRELLSVKPTIRSP